ncbi:hypothetical protein [Rathayibacter sp. VKM Ac-2857]|uniref:hypothetical protein n=1 Tax=Rathayibacter sp. VKM Ac-2857 TaxID=2739020 RepID=UPI00156747B2|nr:hypothetical protein [Rathayibacter sp. VKM Ac-2857]NQX16903.1 hypothetical protein [Rathayibacter sp. VKM Ac-2857]
MNAAPVIVDLIAALERPHGIHPGLAHQVSAQLALLAAPPRPAHRVRRISPFPVRRLARSWQARSRQARPTRTRLASGRAALGTPALAQRRLK